MDIRVDFLKPSTMGSGLGSWETRVRLTSLLMFSKSLSRHTSEKSYPKPSRDEEAVSFFRPFSQP